MQYLSQFIVLAAHGAHSEPPLLDIDGTAFVQFGLFLIALVIFRFLFFKPYLNLHQARQQGTTLLDEEAKSAAIQAELLMSDYQTQYHQAYTLIEKERQLKFQQEYSAILADYEANKAAILAEHETRHLAVLSQTQSARQQLTNDAESIGRLIKDKLLLGGRS